MEKTRETRRASILGSNGFKRRRHRNSPDEDGRVELQESVRLRDRVKKDRDLRERHSRSRRRIADDETSEESFNDEDDDEDEENVPASAGRLFPPPSGSVSNNHHLQHRKSFPPGFSSTSSSSKIHRASPVWKPGDEIISSSIPRKARSACTKRSHDWNSSSSNNINGGGGAEQISRQPSSSPSRQSGVVSTSTPSPADPMSPPSPSSNYFFNKKLKTNGNNTGPNPKPPKSAPSKHSSSNREELEIEIAEVLYGLKIQSQGPSSDSKESNRSNGDAKSPPICNSGPVHTVAPKSKRPRQAVENSGHDVRPVEMDQAPKGVISSPSPENVSGENGFGSGGNLVNSQEQAAEPAVAGEIIECRDLVGMMKEKESCVVKNEDKSCIDSGSTATAFSSVSKIKAKSKVSDVEIQREQKFEIDLMALPPQARSSPEKAASLDPKSILSFVFDAETKPVVTKDEENEEKNRSNSAAEESEEPEAKKKIDNNVRNINLHFDLVKDQRNEIKLQQQKPGQPKSSSALPSPMASWPGALPPMGTYMAPPLQGVVSMDGPTATSPIQPLFTQPRPKRCATHSYIARNIHCMQQIMKMNPFWQAAVPSASFFGSKPCNPIVMPTDPIGKGLNINSHDKGELNSVASNPNDGVKDKSSQNATSSDSAQRKQQILIQQALPTVAPSNLLAPAFIFPYQQQAAVAAAAAASARTNSTKPHTTTDGSASSNPSSSAGAAATAMSFNYPPMAANETQYLAFLQNNGYPFPIQPVGPPPNYRGPPSQAAPFFNGSFYPSQMIHPSQMQHHQQIQQPTHPSQKNVPGHQQSRPQSSSGPGKSQQSSQQSLPSNNNQHGHLSRPVREDSPTTTTDSSRGSRPPVNMYGPNFAMPIHPQNIAMMTNQNEKRPQQPQQFGMSLGAINGPGIDVASMAQNHGIFQNFPEATRQNIQNMMAAAAAAAQAAHMNNMNYNNNRISEDDKSGAGDSSTNGAERKNSSNQNGFRKQSTDPPVVESSGKAPDATAQTSRLVMNNADGAMNVLNAHHHIQGKLQQQLKQQQQMAIHWSKAQVTNNGPVLAEHLKTNFPQNLVQSNNISPSHSPQWKNTSRMPISQAPSSLASSTNLKNHNSRPTTQTHNQISFGANPKPSTTTNSQGQAPMSPTNSSVSKGSSRTTSSNSTNTKTGQGPIFPAQQLKNTPSILGNPNAAKTQMQQQLFFSNSYSQVQSPHSTSTSSITSGPNGFYMQRRRPDQHQHPGPLNSTSMNDPARAFAAATSNVKGGGLPSQGIVHAAHKGGPVGGTFLPPGFSYVHPVPSAAQVKPAEQKQPAGNANFHPWQLEKK